MKPEVSVIMPAYNVENYIKQAIESILDQSFQNWELIICDDASTDNTLTVIKEYHKKNSRIKLFRNEVNIGSLKTRNNLFKECKGNFIVLQDADDWSATDRLEKLFNAFLSDPDLYLCGSWATYYLGNKMIKEKKTPLEWYEIKENIIRQNCFSSASIMFRKTVLEEINGYREYFSDKGNYDYDFTARISEKYRSTNLPDFLYKVNIRAESNSRLLGQNTKLKIVSHKLVQYLIEERRVKGFDSIQSNDGLLKLKKIEDNFLSEIESEHHFDDVVVNQLLQNRLYSEAIKISVRGFIEKPHLKSLKLFLYAFRVILKSILK